MHRSHASAAALGTSAALAAAFLAQPAPMSAVTRNARARSVATATQRAHVGATMHGLVRSTAHTAHTAPPAETRTVTIALCHDCAPSRALVRVLLRRQRHGIPLPPLRFFADRPWPALDTLARHTRSTVVIVRQLAARVGVTPAAISSTRTTPAIGMHDVLALATRQSAHHGRSPR